MDHDYEQVFMNMPQSTLKAVIHVITNQAHSQTFTIKDVAQEYLSNRRIYDNLPKGNDTSKPKQGSQKSQNQIQWEGCNMETRAIVILYEGVKAPEKLMIKLAQTLKRRR